MFNLDLKQGEHLILKGLANKWQTFGSKGGELFLTNQRLVFVAHALNFGSKFDEIPLSSIATSGNSFKFRTTSNLISFNLRIETKSGENIAFVVTRKQKDLWIQKIGEAITEYVLDTVVLSENLADKTDGAKSAVTQIKVVDCKSCGAYVVVMGGLAKCEYCGRPTV
jgi:hypothetical protein